MGDESRGWAIGDRRQENNKISQRLVDGDERLIKAFDK